MDAMPGGYVCSGSFKGELGTTEVRECVLGKRPVRKLFSKAQREFYEEHAPAGLQLDDLAILGPVHVLKLKFTPGEFKRRLAVEAWLYPDGSQILELSLKCKPRDAFQVAAETRAFLTGRGVDLSGDQQTKTYTALEYFSSQLRD